MPAREPQRGAGRQPATDGAGAGLASRRAALRAIAAVDAGGYSNRVVGDAVDHLPTSRDRAFASHLAYDTLRWQGTLRWALALVTRRPLAEVEPDLERILRLGALQLLRTSVPARAAVDTAARLARGAVPRSRGAAAAGFVNGVLRALVRRRDDLPWPDPGADPVSALALSTGHPSWIVEEALPRLGGDGVRSLLEADNEPPGLTLRATGDRHALVAELVRDGVDARPSPVVATAVRAPGADPRRLAAVIEGRAVPQDEASMLVVERTGVRPGAAVVDLCAGPGGKAVHLASLAGAAGHVTAVEVHPRRAQAVRDLAARVREAVDVVVGDGRDRDVASGTADVVLVDAPCTGLGTGRRRPEVRWRRTAADAEALAAVQEELLRAGAARVRAGGRLTYSVCTWTATETTRVAERFTTAHPEFALLDAEQLRPDLHDTDGMFVATWRRA